MTSSAREIEDLITQVDAEPYGRYQRRLLRTALTKVAELDDPDLEYRLRMRETTSAFMIRDTEAMLTSFTWCLAWYDIDPARFRARVDGQDLLSQFKWMAEVLVSNPTFTLDQINRTVDDMERHYAAAGVGLSGVWQVRFANAFETGYYEKAVAFREARDIAGDDVYGHCSVCMRSDDIVFAFESGQPDVGLKAFDEFLEGDFTCGEEPERAQGHSLLALLRAGRIDDAVHHHRMGLRLAEAALEPLPLVIPHITFLAVTGNLARGFDLLERYLVAWPENRFDMRTRFRVALSFAILLDALTAADRGDLLVRSTADPSLVPLVGEHDGEWTVADLAGACWRIADDLATRFDTRNGTGRFVRKIAEARALADEHYDVGLGEPLPPPATAAPPPPLTAEELFASARLRSQIKGGTETVLAELRAGLALVADDDHAMRCEFLHHLVKLSAVTDLPSTDETTTAYVSALRDAGRPGAADLVARFGSNLVAAVPGLDVDAWVESDDVHARAMALSYLIQERLAEGDAPGAVEVADRLLGMDDPSLRAAQDLALLAVLNQAMENSPDDFEAMAKTLVVSDEPWIGFAANIRLALHMGQHARSDEGIEPAERALAIALGHTIPELTMRAADLCGRLLAEAGRLDEAIWRQRLALRQAQPAGSPVEVDLRFELGMRLHEAGRLFEAADEFGTAALVAEAAGHEPGHVATLRMQEGISSSVHEPGRARSSLKAAEQLAADGEPELRIRIWIALGEVQAQLNDADAVETFAQAHRLAEESLPAVVPITAYWLGQTMCQFRDAAGLNHLEDALTAQAAAGNDLLVAIITDSIGQGLVKLGRIDDGIAKMLMAADLFAAAGNISAAAGSEVEAARALREVGRAEDAVAAYEAGRDRLASEPEHLDAMTAEFAAYLDEIGDRDRAARLRSTST